MSEYYQIIYCLQEESTNFRFKIFELKQVFILPKIVLFLFYHLLASTKPFILSDTTLQAFILHLSFFSALRFSNLLSQAKSLT